MDADVWGKFISRRVHLYVFSTVLAEEVFFIEDHGPNMRKQDEQEARLHVLNVMCNLHSYKILLHVEIQCPLWPKAHNSKKRLVKSNPLTSTIQDVDKGSPLSEISALASTPRTKQQSENLLKAQLQWPIPGWI